MLYRWHIQPRIQEHAVNLVLIQNGSSGSEQLYSKRVVLSDNATWQNAINFKPTAVVDLKMEFLLFTGSNSSAPYREVIYGPMDHTMLSILCLFPDWGAKLEHYNKTFS